MTAWGIQDTPDGDYQFKYFKLLLSDDGAEAAQQLGDISSDIAHAERLNKSPINLAADFLRCLWLHTLKHLAKKLPNLLENLAFKVVVTVPANWDHAAQDRTRQAVEESGILRHPKRPYGVKSTELIIVSEPEASAFAVINDEQREVTLEVRTFLILANPCVLMPGRKGKALWYAMRVVAQWYVSLAFSIGTFTNGRRISSAIRSPKLVLWH